MTRLTRLVTLAPASLPLTVINDVPDSIEQTVTNLDKQRAADARMAITPRRQGRTQTAPRSIRWQAKGGIGPSRSSPNVLLFADPATGEQHGYVDDWQEDGCFHYTGEGSDRKSKIFALVFDNGEEVVAGLLQFAKDPKLSGAHLTAIGALERITLGFFDVTKKDSKRIAIQEQVELMSLVGNIAQDDKGDPKLHAHFVVGKSDGTARGGHLLDTQVRPTLEVVVCRSVATSAPLDAPANSVLPCWICRDSRFSSLRSLFVLT